MLRISLPWILEVVASIDQLAGLEADTNRRSAQFLCNSAKIGVQNIFEQSIYKPYLKVSRQKATELIETLDRICKATKDETLTTYDAWAIRYFREQFRNVFFAELSVLPSFLATGKEGYDINTLIDEGQKLFPVSTLNKCPEAGGDMQEAGKALAFELATSCGFHIFRVTEAVLKRYWDHVSGGEKRPDLETIGTYAKALESKKLGDKKIWEALKQLASLHRNPLIHPEAVLTVEEAIDTLGIARSVIAAMLRKMPDIPPTTTQHGAY